MSKLTVLALLAVVACSSSAELTSAPPQSVTGSNGVYQNGLTTNGVYQNGVYQNGVYQNGVYQNGVYQNGVYQNGVYQNGVYQNGVYQNGVYQNGVYQNGVYQNGVYQNGVYQNGVYQNGVYQNGHWETGLWSTRTWTVGSNAEAMRTNRYTRQFFQYVYACAMPGSFDPSIGPPSDPASHIDPLTYTTSIDPNDGSLACNAQGGCDEPFYTCSADHKCVVPLEGSVGVGVNANGSTWWGSGNCDETCQRWVSACVLARTNAYGVHVDISMRAPENAPQTIKNALAVDTAERASYSLREGAYYGNVFATTPVTPPSDPNFDGDPGLIMATPQFFACAGPGSNIPEVTKRFCSSQGDQAVISVPGTCLATGSQLPTCAAEDVDSASPTFGALGNCYTSTSWAGLTPYEQVITVFLKQPIAVCGNEICEQTESATSCPSDCHGGTWSRELPGGAFSTIITTSGGSYHAGWSQPVIAKAPDGGFVGVGLARGDVVVDDTVVPNVVSPALGPISLVVVRYAADGHYLWSQRVVPNNWGFGGAFVAVGPDGSVILDTIGDTYSGGPILWVAKLASTGALQWQTSIGASASNWIGNGPIAVDATGNILITGSFINTVTFGATTLVKLGSESRTAFAVKLTPAGSVAWAQRLGLPFNSWGVLDATFDPTGNPLLVVTMGGGFTNGGPLARVNKLDGSTGDVLWLRGTTQLSEFTSVASDSAGNVYVGGSSYASATDYGWTGTCLPSSSQSGSMFVAKFSPDSALQWVAHPKSSCVTDFSFAQKLAVDTQGNVIASGILTGNPDFGAGVFNTYAYPNVYAAAFRASDGAFAWAKHIPIVLHGALDMMSVDANGRVAVAGPFTGSMEVDGHLLVTDNPADPWTASVFLASFAEPPADLDAPQIGRAIDEVGMVVDTIPSTITIDATSTAGATAFFMPPTAIDDGNAGVTVACLPPPNTTFVIGTTPVTCVATDARGNHSSATFDVVVRDRLGPTISGLPGDITSSSHVVTFSSPAAIDQVDGVVPVTCAPASGTSFPNGATTVTCSSTDAHTNTSTGSFVITVETPPDTTPPQIHVPNGVTVEATGANGAPGTFSATATDDVDGTDAVTCTPASGSVFAIGAHTVVCTAHDAAGNSASASFAVVVQDTAPPALTLPTNILAAATDASGAVVTYPATANDAVDGFVAVACIPASGTTFAIGVTTVTCNASDAHSNTSQGSFIVTIAPPDTTPPVITAPGAMTLEATSASGAAATFNPTATDNIDGTVGVTCTPASGSVFAIGAHTVSCTAQDAAGNIANASFGVTVQDTQAPTLMLPANIVASAAPTSAVVTYSASANDVVDGIVAATCTPASGSTFALGTTTVNCTAIDAHANSSSGSFTVTVRDTAPPVITVPSLGSVEAIGPVGSAVAYTVSASDTIDGSVTAACSPASGSTFAIGATTVNCNAHDAAGNAATASFVVGVVDTTAPALVVPADITGEATGGSGLGVSFSTSATDLVDGVRPVTCSSASGSTFAIGTTPVTCTTSDTRGNTRNASFTVTVVDTTRPTLTVPANITRAATDASGAVVTYTATATDSVDGAITPTCLPTSGSTFPVGTTTVTCSAVDAHSNAVTASFTITVTPLATDTTPPVITVPANITTSATSATGAPVTFAVSAVDAVDGSVAVTCSKTSGSAFVLGTTTVTCSAHDAHDNTATRTFSVSVQVSWGGVLLPINTDGSAEFKLGSIVPVRFALTGASANITNAVATVTFTKLSSTITGTRHKLPRYLAPTSGTTAKWNPVTHHYYFRYDTTGLTQGTYKVTVDFHDGVSHTTQFSLGSFGCPSCENDGGDD